MREGIFALFRDPAFVAVEPDAEPQLYGDKAEVPPDTIEPRQWLALTPLQYRHLKAWSEGRFTPRRRRPSRRASRIMRLQDRPAALDRAVLDACIGGAFHPGIEFPWIVRTAWIWTADMRLKIDVAGGRPHRLRRHAHRARRAVEDGAVVAPRTGQHHPVDGRAVARRRVQLPVRL